MKKAVHRVTAVVLSRVRARRRRVRRGRVRRGQDHADLRLWDDNQQAAYQQCADAFQKANPDITVKITQTAWDQYWQNLTTQMVSGDAPDVITDQASYYPQFVKNGQILDIQPLSTRTRSTSPSTRPAWPTCGQGRQALRPAQGLGHHGHRLQHQARQGQARAVDLTDLTWNPNDGGTFEQAIAKLTVDTAGKQRRRTRLRQDQGHGVRLRARAERRLPGARTAGATWRSPTASPTSTRTRSAPSTSTTTPSSSRPRPGSRPSPTRATRRRTTRPARSAPTRCSPPARRRSASPAPG